MDTRGPLPSPLLYGVLEGKLEDSTMHFLGNFFLHFATFFYTKFNDLRWKTNTRGTTVVITIVVESSVVITGIVKSSLVISSLVRPGLVVSSLAEISSRRRFSV